MKRFRLSTLLLEAILLCLITIGDASSDSVSLSPKGLYDQNDNVIILHVNNFTSSIYGSNTSWVVEFYNSWCGFCQRYAPTWKAMARNILSWRYVVKVAALDCSDDSNNQLCRDYEVSHYPMVKFFAMNEKPGSLGLKLVDEMKMTHMRYNIVEQLALEMLAGRGSTWPNILPYRNSDLKSIWKSVKEDVKYIFVIFEKLDSFVASEVIFDFGKEQQLHIRRVTVENEALNVAAKITKYPSMIVLHRDGFQKPIEVDVPTREGVKKLIQDYMDTKGIHIELDETREEYPEYTRKAPRQMPMLPLPPPIPSHPFGDVLFQLDLETALQYSLNHEIPSTKIIEEDKLAALKAYLYILASYFPMRKNGVVFLSTIYEVVEEKKNISGEEFRRLISSTEDEMSPIFSGPLQWIGCKGSSDKYRGYPCGLWTTFHMLTVNFAVQSFDQMQDDPTKVLRAIHGYVKNFFGCDECSKHFLEMSSRRKIYEVKSKDENILWLWRAHNEVNARLSGDSSEDFAHKKIQYPSEKDCPLCKDGRGNWKEDQVLVYLKKKYRYEGINFYKTSSYSKQDERDITKVRKGRLASANFMNARNIGWNFTIFDVSICVVLYVMSAMILILICVKFAVRGSYRRKGFLSSTFVKV